jgi:glycosidase
MIWWWKETGIDGFRLDALKHMHLSWLTDLRARTNTEIDAVTGKHFYMVGETYTGDKGLIKYYVDPLKKLDGQFDFPQRAEICSKILLRQGSMQELESFLNGNDSYYDKGIMSTFIGNHDLPRVIHLAQDTPLWTDSWDGGKNINWANQPGLPGEQSAFERMAAAFTLLMTTRGVPLIYYGDEIGLPGAGDPDNRRDMQWSGYSAGQNLLKTHLEKLGQIRKDHVALRRGNRFGCLGHDRYHGVQDGASNGDGVRGDQSRQSTRLREWFTSRTLYGSSYWTNFLRTTDSTTPAIGGHSSEVMARAFPSNKDATITLAQPRTAPIPITSFRT